MEGHVDIEPANKILREIGSILFRGLQEEMKGKTWSCAFVDIRRPEKGNTRIAKMRLVLPDGSTCALLDTPLENPPTEVLDLFDEVWKLRDKLFTKRWFGIKLTVDPTGKCDVSYNYEAKCS